MKSTYLSLLLMVFLFTIAKAQELPCGATEVNNKALENNPELREKAKQLEEFTQAYVKSSKHQKKGTVKVIPIVFHVIHDYGSENISKAQIEDAVRVINEDFRKLNSDTGQIVNQFKGIAADSEVEFRLAKLDPNGNCTQGITRTQSKLTFDAGENVKSLVSWDTDMYLNVWVVDNISSGAGAYAYYPGYAPSPSQEGIVCRHTQLGSIGTSNGGNFSTRTLTHEIGHYLNLPHTWGSTNSNADPNNCTSDDGVTDTPNTIGSNINCNLGQNTCSSLDNVQNYMDYATCTNMFTNGQKARMQAALNSSMGSRNSLWTSSNLVATGTNAGFTNSCAPISDFKSSDDMVCAGNSISFSDLSYNADVDGSWTWNWSFPGGTPSSSTQQNPVVQYNAAGTYNVTLTVSNSQGNNSLTKSGYVNIGAVSGGEIAPFQEGIESSSFPAHPTDNNKDWLIDDNSSSTWSRNTDAANSGMASMRIFNAVIPKGVKNSLISPPIDYSGPATHPYLYFQVAYAKRTSTSNDGLKVYISTNCGKTWALRYAESGNNLATNGGTPVTSLFYPSAGEWRKETVPLSSFIGNSNVLVKFECTSDDGNFLYIDDINIGGTPNSIDEVNSKEINLSVFPNPSLGEASISFSTGNSMNEVELLLTDNLGRVAGKKVLGEVPAGEHNLKLNALSGGLESGIYFVRLKSNTGSIVKKIVVTGN